MNTTEITPHPCPNCGEMNTDNWPITVNNVIAWGGCQMCWEVEVSASWWAEMDAIAREEE